MKTTHKVGEYIAINQNRSQVWLRMINNKLYFRHQGRWMDKSQFNNIYPKAEYKRFNDKGENPDWKKNL